MENASKALLMAAGVLIGVLILTLAVYLFVTFGSTSAQIHEKADEDKINQFNAQFTKYQGKDDITIYDIVTIANLAKENNQYYELNSQANGNYYIMVSLGTKKNLEKKTQSELEKLIKDEELSDTYLPIYKCNIIINPTTKRVSKVSFSK